LVGASVASMLPVAGVMFRSRETDAFADVDSRAERA
jgi:hypothetical protein